MVGHEARGIGPIGARPKRAALFHFRGKLKKPLSCRGFFHFRRSKNSAGRQVHTASPSATAPFVCARRCVHRIPQPNVRDDRDTPLSWDGMAGDKPVIWVEWKAECFCGADWTSQISLNWLNKSRFPRRRTFTLFAGQKPFAHSKEGPPTSRSLARSGQQDFLRTPPYSVMKHRRAAIGRAKPIPAVSVHPPSA